MGTNEAQAGFNIGMIILSLMPLIGLAGWLFWDVLYKPTDEDKWWDQQNAYYEKVYQAQQKQSQKLKERPDADSNIKSKLHNRNIRGL